jgi:hypothetical protein
VPFSSLQNPKKDPLNFSLFLKSLDFDQKQIINLCSHLF